MNLSKIWMYFSFFVFALLVLNFLAFSQSSRIYQEISKGNLYEAQKLIYQVLDSNPNDTDALFAKSIIMYKYAEIQKSGKEKYYQILEILNSLSKKLNGFYYYHFIKGKVLEKTGQIQESFKEYDNAIYHNPKFEEAYISKSLLYWKLEDFDQSFKVLNPIKEKFKTKILLSHYYYQLGEYDQSLFTLEEILNNPIHMKQIKENRQVLGELYFQMMWVNYRKNSKSLAFWIEQNIKYNPIDYYYSLSEALSANDDEEKVKKILYNISNYPDKPYGYFVVYQILKKHSKNEKRNYIYFLKKAVECDIYNLDFKNVLKSENY
ncbi:MAG: tetratricopeptide repeat protein [bacterium]